MKDKFIHAYMDVAKRFAKLSTAKRLQVGAIIVKHDRIISIGYNGMPSGWDNCCEIQTEAGLETKREVLHAESNAIAKLARSSESGESASIFVTHQPCLECAKLIYQAGISSVYYNELYRLKTGIDFLHTAGVKVLRVNSASVSYTHLTLPTNREV